MFDKDFYPTPDKLITLMLNKVNIFQVNTVLEPSAGKGNILDFLSDSDKMGQVTWSNHKGLSEVRRNWRGNAFDSKDLCAIELIPDLQATLRGKDYTVIDSDYLSYTGSEHFDLIIANYPFSDGHLHLIKSIETTFSGQIVCLLNAETIKNPYTNDRKRLIDLLEKNNADIEYIQDAFISAERKTGVEIALIYMNIKKTIETDLFEDMSEESETVNNIDQEEKNDLVSHDQVVALLQRYDAIKTNHEQQIFSFYKSYCYSSKYLSIDLKSSVETTKTHGNNLTSEMKYLLNKFYKQLKQDFWLEVLKIDDVYRYITTPVIEDLRASKDKYLSMEFTLPNIRQFIMNLSKNFPNMIQQSIEHVFDKMTEHALREGYWKTEEYEKSIHYYNAWKTNSGYKINKKVIQPFYCYRSGYFGDYSIGEKQSNFLRDLEVVCDYFTSEADKESNIVELCKIALKDGNNRNIMTRHFKISVFKKGTIHLTFNNQDTLRQLNIAAAKHRGWLPYSYGSQNYNDLAEEQKDVVELFESKKEYKIVDQTTFASRIASENKTGLNDIKFLALLNQGDELCA